MREGWVLVEGNHDVGRAWERGRGVEETIEDGTTEGRIGRIG